MTVANERRAAPRYEARSNIYVLMVHPGAAARTCRLANVSRTGALVTRAGRGQPAADAPRLASDVVLRFGNSGAGRYQSVLARVQRIDDGGIGLGFADPLADDVQDLYRHALDAGRTGTAVQPPAAAQLAAAPPTHSALRKDDVMQIDLDESAPRLTVEPRAAPGASGRDSEPAAPGIDDPLSRVTSRTGAAVVIGLLVLAVLAVFLAIRNYQISADLERLEERVIALAEGPGDQAGARLGMLENRVAELQQAVSGLAAGADAAGAADAGNETTQRLGAEIEALKKDVAALSSRAPAPVTRQTAAAQAADAWVVQVAAVKDAAEARELAAQVERAGFDADTEKATVKGSTFFRVIATGFGTQDQARAAAARLERDLGLDSAPWVAKR